MEMATGTKKTAANGPKKVIPYDQYVDHQLAKVRTQNRVAFTAGLARVNKAAQRS